MTKFLKISALFTVFAFIFAFLHITMPDTINANADGVAEIAMELNTGRVLHCKNERKKLPMASTTKIMTALIIIEDCNPDEEVIIPDEAVGTEGSSIYLKYGEKLTIRDLVYGLMLRSGNDAAVALAIIHSGDTERFADAMNDRAQELGASDTHFANPNGLPAENHYTTARDLCNIARTAMQNKMFAKVVGTTDYRGDYRNFTNKNKLLYSFEGANGIKTGYTDRAGRCLVSSAERNGMDVVCVVLNCYDMYERSSEILSDCFRNFALETISPERVFIWDGRRCSLKSGVEICIEKDGEIEYVIVPVRTSDTRNIEEPIAQLQIFSEKDLIFTANLYSIM